MIAVVVAIVAVMIAVVTVALVAVAEIAPVPLVHHHFAHPRETPIVALVVAAVDIIDRDRPITVALPVAMMPVAPEPLHHGYAGGPMIDHGGRAAVRGGAVAHDDAAIDRSGAEHDVGADPLRVKGSREHERRNRQDAGPHNRLGMGSKCARRDG